MHLVSEHVARAHLAQRLEKGRQRQHAARLVAALRAERRAEAAAVRARHLLALAVHS